VSGNLENLFARLGAATDEVPLAGPERLRRLGDRQTRARRTAGIAAVAVAGAVLAAGAAVTLGRPGHTPPPGTVPTAGRAPSHPPTPDGTPSPSAPPGTSPGGHGDLGGRSPDRSPTPRPAGAPCQRGDLAVRPIQANGGGGSVGYAVVAVNQSATRCRLTGSPTLVWIRPDGRQVTLPTDPAGAAGPAVLVPPGRTGSFIITVHNGTWGYPPSAPACAHPVTYRNISAVLSGGDRLPLPGLVLDVRCDGVTVTDWSG
jgi:Domain of unknown function (DUF4232)